MLVPAIQKYVDKTRYQKLEQNFTTLFFDILEPNIFYDEEFTQKVIDEEIRGITVNKGLVTENERIIAKGDVVEGTKYEILMLKLKDPKIQKIQLCSRHYFGCWSSKDP